MGQPLDEIESILFSPDGARVAWVGFRGGRRVVAVDGQEGPGFGTITGPVFSAHGGRVAYAGADIVSGLTGHKGRGRAIIDGQAGPQFEGTRLPLTDPSALDASDNRGLVPLLAAHGRLDPVYASHLLYRFHGVSAPVFSPDGSRVAYAARRGKDDEVVFLDGKPGTAAASIAGLPVFSSDGSRLAFAVSAGSGTKLVVDGTPLEHACSSGTDYVSAIAFAPDNRRVAYVGVGGGHMYQIGMSPRAKRSVYVDGQAVSAYDALGIAALRFTPDSRHSVYVVQGVEEASREVSVVVIDGTEGKRYDEVYPATLSADGAAVVYTARAGRKYVRVTQPLG